MTRPPAAAPGSACSRRSAAVVRLEQSRRRLSGLLKDGSDLAVARALLVRAVRRHPRLAVALAVLLGAVLARARPWRWLLRPALWATLLPALLAALGLPSGGQAAGWAEWLAGLLRPAAGPKEPAPPPS
jgi:hypothetical protein